ncbi:MAG: hypothetical protein HOW73_43620 [Polyangiaceae bacterium]|nr:hypothetical protein [Polyangiaceae bacterium]
MSAHEAHKRVASRAFSEEHHDAFTRWWTDVVRSRNAAMRAQGCTTTPERGPPPDPEDDGEAYEARVDAIASIS